MSYHGSCSVSAHQTRAWRITALPEITLSRWSVVCNLWAALIFLTVFADHITVSFSTLLLSSHVAGWLNVGKRTIGRGHNERRRQCCFRCRDLIIWTCFIAFVWKALLIKRAPSLGYGKQMSSEPPWLARTSWRCTLLCKYAFGVPLLSLHPRGDNGNRGESICFHSNEFTGPVFAQQQGDN